MEVYIVFMLLGVLATLLVGSVGYFICYLKKERKVQEVR